MIHHDERIQVGICVDLLAQHNKIHYLSLVATLGIILTALIMAVFSSATIVLLLVALLGMLFGVLETWLAVRVGFDEALLRRWSLQLSAQAWNLESMDQALMALKLMPTHKAGRDLDSRLQACIGLLHRQSWYCAAQYLALLVILAVQIGGNW